MVLNLKQSKHINLVLKNLKSNPKEILSLTKEEYENSYTKKSSMFAKEIVCKPLKDTLENIINETTEEIFENLLKNHVEIMAKEIAYSWKNKAMNYKTLLEDKFENKIEITL